MNDLRTAAQQALEALGLWATGRDMDAVALNDLIHRLEAALAEPEGQREKEIEDLRFSLDFYQRRCEALQSWQSKMRDPERTIVCDILANGFALDPAFAGDRYTAPPKLPAEPVQEPVGWLYPEGLAALHAGKCWTAYGTKQNDNNVPIYDAVAPRAEPRASESGAGFESPPASPEPVQEPVKRMTAPPQRKPLSDADLAKIWDDALDQLDPRDQLRFIARAIERLHGIGGQP